MSTTFINGITLATEKEFENFEISLSKFKQFDWFKEYFAIESVLCRSYLSIVQIIWSGSHGRFDSR
jgi:hypothetical protein